MSANPDNSIDLNEVIEQLQASGSMPAELLEIFAEEAEDHLQTIYDGLNRLRSNHGDFGALADVRRASHTLKGAAAAVGLKAATRLAHRMEDLLDRLAENKQAANQEQVSLLLTTADQLQALTSGDVDVQPVARQLVEIYEKYAAELSVIQPSSGPPVVEPEEPLDIATTSVDEPIQSTNQIESNQTGSAAAKRTTQYLRVPINRLDNLVRLIGELIVNRSAIHERLDEFESRIEDMHTALDRLRHVTHQFDTDYTTRVWHKPIRSGEQPLSDPNAIRLASGTDANRMNEFDALEFDQYTDFHLLTHTLSEANNDAEIVASEFRNLKAALEILSTRQQRLNRDAQNSLMRIRMVPLSGIVSRLERTVRTVSNKLGRAVELEVVGQRTELDKTVLDEIVDPIQHLIRNAIDHGVEEPDARSAAGKPATARLKLEAINQGTQVTIRIIDDGAGINLEKVRAQATARELITEDQDLSSEELHALIFVPGFSTAASLTDVSGRGVGMDVVRDAVQRLKGTIRVDSEPGLGTTFTIQLPTTVGVARALLVESHGQTFAIPMQSVKQIERLERKSIYYDGDKPMLGLSGRTMPIKDLSAHLQLATSEDACSFEHAKPMLIVCVGDDEAAITIDTIKGCREIVIKTLGDHLKKVPGLIGATLSGDGTVIPILDPADLIGQYASVLSPPMIQQDHHSPVISRKDLAMVIDDSISVRRVTTSLLHSAGWDVVTAKDGVDALAKLAELESLPDVFLCDMEMPRMDGIQLIKQIRKQDEFELTPIVMVTSRASEKHRHMAIDAGATDYVVKPYNDDRLLALITGLVQSARETVIA